MFAVTICYTMKHQRLVWYMWYQWYGVVENFAILLRLGASSCESF